MRPWHTSSAMQANATNSSPTVPHSVRETSTPTTSERGSIRFFGTTEAMVPGKQESLLHPPRSCSCTAISRWTRTKASLHQLAVDHFQPIAAKIPPSRLRRKDLCYVSNARFRLRNKTFRCSCLALLGSGAGALVTAVFYSDQIRTLKNLLAQPLPEILNPKPEDADRKSA